MNDKRVVDETILKRYLSYMAQASQQTDARKRRAYQQMAEALVKPLMKHAS